MKRADLFQAAVTQWGATMQKMMLFEEMAELQKAVIKHIRGRGNTEQIAEEIADVENMLDQMKFMYNIPQKQITRYRRMKLKRMADLLA